jgi:hypothetical protein
MPDEPMDQGEGDHQPPAPQARASTDPWAHRRGEPRTFAAAWILFVFLATVLSVGAVGVFGILSTDVYRPAARGLLEVVTIGIVILWPMVRLSQEAPERALRSIAIDVLIVVVPAQVVIWPQALAWMAAWPPNVVAAVSLLISGWGVLIGGLMAAYFLGLRGVGTTGNGGPPGRCAMMAVIVLMIGIGPVIAALSPRTVSSALPHTASWLMTSPLTAIYEVTRDRPLTGQSAAVDVRHWTCIWLIWGAGLLVWLVDGVMASVRVASKGRVA